MRGSEMLYCVGRW